MSTIIDTSDTVFRILLCEDDDAIATGLIDSLQEDGFVCTRARHGAEALACFASSAPTTFHLMLLDVRLGPGPDGFAVCKTLRDQAVRIPIIMLTARDEEIDRILGLEIGADDYVVKPFRYRELSSRIRAQLRRAWGSLSAAPLAEKIRHFGQCRYDEHAMRLFIGDVEQSLTPVELRMLRFFLDHPNQALSRRQIIDAVWSDGWVLEDERAVDVHIRHLREKIESDASNPVCLTTVRGFGYRFEQHG